MCSIVFFIDHHFYLLSEVNTLIPPLCFFHGWIGVSACMLLHCACWLLLACWLVLLFSIRLCKISFMTKIINVKVILACLFFFIMFVSSNWILYLVWFQDQCQAMRPWKTLQMWVSKAEMFWRFCFKHCWYKAFF